MFQYFMKLSSFILFSLLIFLVPMETILFDFSEKADVSDWQIVNDNVMGGRSNSKLLINDAGNGVFTGTISLENNGGFASTRYNTGTYPVLPNQTIKIRLKGDGQRYQFRVKNDKRAYWSYIQYFDTSGDWETVTIALGAMYPTYRGRRLEAPNFAENQIEELGFLIGNKKEATFALEIDYVAID
ncbi:Complex I intermediate-associated protein 30 [Croceitalea dokdonensis DOKDO 023]|uniref:Complex I intermediate-associated protein 30 n=2 Tax=Croceitalea TaxID=574891 RepID=A0A0P7B127_9FLAO|nr:Complex I intermediate-associated protein 30 [Croceitalea dokdonensis DOKDO 023]